MSPFRWSAAALAATLAAFAVAQTSPATPASVTATPVQAAPPGAPTYAQVGALLEARCTSCHRPGGIAPFALTTYEQVAPRAQQIAAVTAARIMPPWPPGPRTPKLKYARTLSDADLKLLADWAAAGAPDTPPATPPEDRP